jgi:hypothetical protein
MTWGSFTTSIATAFAASAVATAAGIAAVGGAEIGGAIATGLEAFLEGVRVEGFLALVLARAVGLFEFPGGGSAGAGAGLFPGVDLRAGGGVS